ncbi:MAG: signal peptidase I [Patescibacteria group bacterium]|nr:signal peptidase I [Patescibacteria group bacterium]
MENEKNALLIFVWEVLKIVVLALLIVIPIRYFLFQPFIVQGASMEPNFHNNDYLIVDELSFRFRDVERGEVVVFKAPNNPSQKYIKRIIGLPNEIVEIKNNEITIFKYNRSSVLDESDYLTKNSLILNSTKFTLKENEYFAIGDNRKATWKGRVPKENIIGRVFVRALPINAFIKIEAPAY